MSDLKGNILIGSQNNPVSDKDPNSLEEPVLTTIVITK